MSSETLPWRWRDEGRPKLVGVASTYAGGSVALDTAHPAEAPGQVLWFALEAASFAHAARVTVDGPAPVAFEVEYLSQGGSGEAAVAVEAWFPIAEYRLNPTVSMEDVIWPDVGAHCHWRLRILEGSQGCKVTVHALLQWQWEVRLDVPAAFAQPACAEAAQGLTAEASICLARGDLVLGNNELLAQLYHESDLLAWGSPIPFPCFLTIWAKPESKHDFAGLVHRFERVRPPLLVMSGTGVEQRSRLRDLLKNLLRPEFQPLVQDGQTADELIGALWRHKDVGAGGEAPPTLQEINGRLRTIQDRLDVPQELRREEYVVQFRRRDPLMLLMTKEAFGGWAPNRVFAEIEGHDIFRTYAEFSCVDGIVCAEDAVWLHSPQDFYRPAQLPERGDKRSTAFLDLLEKQRPYIDKLLDHYIEQGMITSEFRAGLETGLLSPAHVAAANT